MRILLLIILIVVFYTSTSVEAQCTTNRNTDIEISKPDNQYIDNGNGTVIDKETGLMWQKCTFGYSGKNCTVGAAQTYSWQAALAIAENYNENGYNDWRLPNKNELESLVENACFTPSINETIFPNTVSNNYWSSSLKNDDPLSAWYINFDTGYVKDLNKNSLYNIRLVRGGLIP